MRNPIAPLRGASIIESGPRKSFASFSADRRWSLTSATRGNEGKAIVQPRSGRDQWSRVKSSKRSCLRSLTMLRVTWMTRKWRPSCKTDVAYALKLSCRAFANNVIPTTESKRHSVMSEWADRGDAGTETPEQQSLAGLDYKFDLADAYDHTEDLLLQYRFEFVHFKPSQRHGNRVQ